MIEKCAEINRTRPGASGSTLLRYLHFLLLKEIEPRWDGDLVEKMASFFMRYRWAYTDGNDCAVKPCMTRFLQQDTETQGHTGWLDKIVFIPVYNWKRLVSCEKTDDTIPFVPFIDQTVAGIKLHIRLRDAFIQPELAESDRENVYVAAVQRDARSFDGLMVISEALYDALGDEEELRYMLAAEYFQAPYEVQHMLCDPELLRELARTLAYLATFPCSTGDFTATELIAAAQKANAPGLSAAAPFTVPRLLELLGFLSDSSDGKYQLTEIYCCHRLLLSAFGACIGCSTWALDEQKSEYAAITEHFPAVFVQRYFPKMTWPETGQTLIEPLLLRAETCLGGLSSEDREALFDFMMDSGADSKFLLRIENALLADGFTQYESDRIRNADPDEVPEIVWEYMQACSKKKKDTLPIL